MKRGIVPITLFAFVLSVAAVSAAYGQATTGELTGRVVDAGGARHAGRHRRGGRTWTPDSPGRRRRTTRAIYTITLLPPGPYTVSAELRDSRRPSCEGVDVLVGTRRRSPWSSQVGAVTESVTVNVGRRSVETTRSDIGGVVTPKEIADLPLLNRTFANCRSSCRKRVRR